MVTTPPDKEKTYAHMAARCAKKEYCCADILRKCLERGLRREEADEVLSRLTSQQFVDESRYARAFVHDKTLYDRWGRIKTRQALRLKHISEADIEAAMEQIDPAAYREALLALLKAKSRSLKAATPYEHRQKLLRYAATRGYEADLAFRVMEDLEEDR